MAIKSAGTYYHEGLEIMPLVFKTFFFFNIKQKHAWHKYYA